jgi:erythromycin esterase
MGAPHPHGGLSSPSPVVWLRSNAAPLRLPPFEDDDFSDLAPLKRVVGDATIVGLGEETHDGTAFLMKARLVRYLHERLGFQVVAFETSLIDCEVTVPLLAAGPPDGISTIRRCVAKEWGRAKELQPLMAYLAEQARAPRPFTTTGFDIIPRKLTADSLRSLFRDAGFAAAADPAPWDTIRDAFYAARDRKLTELSTRRESARAVVRQLRAALASRGSLPTADIRSRALDSVDATLTWWLDDVLAESHGDGGAGHAATFNLRDETQAQNVLWLAENRYPGRKIILWAANFHLLKSLDSIQAAPERDLHSTRTMGQMLGSHFVSLACIADEGRASNHGSGSEAVDPHTKDAIESMLTQAGFETALVDLHASEPASDWIHTPFIAGPLGYEYLRNRWDLSFDALIFTRHMEPSTLVPDSDADAGIADSGMATPSAR